MHIETMAMPEWLPSMNSSSSDSCIDLSSEWTVDELFKLVLGLRPVTEGLDA